MRIVLVTAFFNNVVISTVIEMVETIEILDGRLGKRSVERVRYVINNLLHMVIVKYGDISLVLCISTRLRLVTILSLLVIYLDISTLTLVISLIYIICTSVSIPMHAFCLWYPDLPSVLARALVFCELNSRARKQNDFLA